jgi:hypothetical protein
MPERANVDALKRNLTQRYERVHATAVQEMVGMLRQAAPKGETGQLADSIDASPTSGPPGISSEVVATSERASWTNDGTQPHEIRPVRAKVLSFEVGGTQVFARYVHHPGNAGTHWWDDTLRDRWPGVVAAALAAQG